MRGLDRRRRRGEDDVAAVGWSSGLGTAGLQMLRGDIATLKEAWQ